MHSKHKVIKNGKILIEFAAERSLVIRSTQLHNTRRSIKELGQRWTEGLNPDRPPTHRKKRCQPY